VGRSPPFFFLLPDGDAWPSRVFVRWWAVACPFAGTSEDRPPRVLSPISPPVLAGCARSGGPIGATRGGKPSEVERGRATVFQHAEPHPREGKSPPPARGDERLPRYYPVDDMRIRVLFIKATQVVDKFLLIRREFDRDHADPVPHRE